MSSPASTSRAAYDRELVAQFLAGDESAFALIVKYYHPKMTEVADRILRNIHDSEEVANDTMLRAHRGLARFRGESSLHTWLHRIATNLAKNRVSYFECRRRTAHVSMSAAVGEFGNATFADLMADQSLEEAPVLADREAFLDLVPRAMRELSPKHQAMLQARTVEMMDYAEIAVRMGMCIGSVKSGLARARMALRRKLQAKHAPLVEAA